MKLEYVLVSANPHDTFDEARPWSGEVGQWQCEIDQGRLSATSTADFDSPAEAAGNLELELRAWAAVAYLRTQHRIAFQPAGAGADATAAVSSAGPARDEVFRRTNETYPVPDAEFRLTPPAERLVELNLRFADRQTSLPAAVAELVAALESSLSETDAQTIESAYNIGPDVTAALMELNGRSREPADGPSLYRGPEWQWLQEALRLITLQVGRRGAAAPAQPLRLEDFRARL